MVITHIKEISSNEDAIEILTEIAKAVNTSKNKQIILSGTYCCPKTEVRNLLSCNIAKDDDERFVWYTVEDGFEILLIPDIFRVRKGEMSDGTIFYDIFNGTNFNEPVYSVSILNQITL